MVTITEEIIRSGMTNGIGISKKQAAIFGLTRENELYPLKQGWINRLIGKEISDEDYKRFLQLTKVKHVVHSDTKSIFQLQKIHKTKFFKLSNDEKWEIVQLLLSKLNNPDD